MPLFDIFCVMFPLSIIHSVCLNILYHQPLSFSITFNEFCVACAFASIVRQVDLTSKIFFSDCLLLNTSLSLEHLCVNFHFFGYSSSALVLQACPFISPRPYNLAWNIILFAHNI